MAFLNLWSFISILNRAFSHQEDVPANMEHSPVGIVFQKEHIKALQGLSEQNNGEVVWTKSTGRTNNKPYMTSSKFLPFRLQLPTCKVMILFIFSALCPYVYTPQNLWWQEPLLSIKLLPRMDSMIILPATGKKDSALTRAKNYKIVCFDAFLY